MAMAIGIVVIMTTGIASMIPIPTGVQPQKSPLTHSFLLTNGGRDVM